MDSYGASDGRGRVFGMIEAGGTKIICAVATGPGEMRARVRLETTMPDQVFEAVKAFFSDAVPEGVPLAGLGVATFGPVDVRDEASPDYGRLMKTPKEGWAGASWVEAFRGVIHGPIVVDTDVNGAALGEAKWGVAKGLGTVVYVTVGTGIGGGVLVDGKPVHGLLHPEIGHMGVPRNTVVDDFPGVCPFHGDCLEGLASGPAIAARWGCEGRDLPSDHEGWVLEAEYLAQMCVNLAVTVSPQRIVLGGGVMQSPRLFSLIRERFLERLGGYLDVPAILGGIDSYIVPPAWGQDAGLIGALALIEARVDR